MNKELLKVLQDYEYAALCAVGEFCRDNNIRFYLRGGSALGAVKYQDFVPCDDDIDIALPRKDYERLIELIPEYFGDKFRFVSHQKTADSHCYFPRILLTEEEREKAGLPSNNERGLVLIDVLPLDGMPDSALGLKLHIFKAYFYRVLASLWTFDAGNTVSMHGGKQQKVLSILHKTGIHHLYKQDTIYNHLDKMYGRFGFGKTQRAGMLASSKLKKEIVPYSWWGKGTWKKFRDEDVRVPADYDSYLKQLFGDNYATWEPDFDKVSKSHITGGGE